MVNLPIAYPSLQLILLVFNFNEKFMKLFRNNYCHFIQDKDVSSYKIERCRYIFPTKLLLKINVKGKSEIIISSPPI